MYLMNPHLEEKIDVRGVIDTILHSVNYNKSKSLEKNIQRLRKEITPLFLDIVKNTIKKYHPNNQKNY